MIEEWKSLCYNKTIMQRNQKMRGIRRENRYRLRKE